MQIKNIFVMFFLLSALSLADRLQPVNYEFVFTEARETQTVTESRVLFWAARTENAESVKLTASLRLVDLPYLDAAGQRLARNVVYNGQSVADYAKVRFAEFAAEVSASAFPSSAGYSYDEQIKISVAAPQFVSLRQTIYAFTGGAHGRTSENIFVLDLDAGRRLAIADVLTASAELTMRLETLLRQKYNMRPGDVFSGAVWPPDNFDFTAAGLELSWGQYVIGPYVWGLPAVVLPYAELQPFLNARGREIVRILSSPVTRFNAASLPPSRQK
ncbi:MAG: DUF3298 and DUF4163 domain-containing protein [Candidatus Margulisbacteria bacterium]|jgi:hypothetical protein|nr:DUF3298 and DUF4163 domain-containing protein [Candidatus Margulisiibacteriota bacterium]